MSSNTIFIQSGEKMSLSEITRFKNRIAIKEKEAKYYKELYKELFAENAIIKSKYIAQSCHVIASQNIVFISDDIKEIKIVENDGNKVTLDNKNLNITAYISREPEEFKSEN